MKINRSGQESTQFVTDAGKGKARRVAGTEFHEEVDVALGATCPLEGRSEDHHTAYVVLST